MKVIDLRTEISDANKIIFGECGEYITDNINLTNDPDCMLIMNENENKSFSLFLGDIDRLIKALKLAKEWF